MSRTIVVTGAASGIGKATTELFVARGDTVIGVDLHAATVTADLSTPEGRQAAVAGVLAEAGESGIDAVVACAGISGNSPAVVAINFFGVTEFVTGLLPALAASSAPRVAVVSSSVSIRGLRDPLAVAMADACLAGDEQTAKQHAAELEEAGRGASVYPGSKAALARWVRRESVTAAFAGAGIPLNAVAPGVVLTPMSAPLFDDPAMVKAMDDVLPMPLGGHQGPEVLANALAWLVAEENTHITGQVVFCDGGAEAVHRGEQF